MDLRALPEYVEPMVSPVSRPDVAKEYPLVLTNAKFTTYIHSQLRGLTESAQSVAPSQRRHSSRDRGAFWYHGQKLDGHRKPARFDSRQSARHRRDRAGRSVLPAWLVARVQGVGAAGLRFLRRRFGQSESADRFRYRRSDQRLAAASIVSVPCPTGAVAGEKYFRYAPRHVDSFSRRPKRFGSIIYGSIHLVLPPSLRQVFFHLDCIHGLANKKRFVSSTRRK